MSDSVLSKLSIQFEADQARLDRGLDQAESKAKRSGQKMEESLSLGGVASKLVAAFAALGTVEAGFRALAGVTQILDGDLQGALESIERMPFGIGPAVGAARDFCEVVSGSREEAERLKEEWSGIIDNIRGAIDAVEELKNKQRSEDSNDPLADTNARSSDINRGIVANNRLIRELSQLQAESRSGFRFGDSDRLQEQVDLTDEWVARLKEIKIEAKTAGEAIEELRRRNAEAFRVGIRGAAEDRERLRAELESRTGAIRATTAREQMQANGQEVELARFNAQLDRDKQLAEARSQAETDAINRQYEIRLSLIQREVEERARLEAEAEREHVQRLEEQRLRSLERSRREQERQAQVMAREAEQREHDRRVEAQAIAAEEFIRTNFGGGRLGQKQEVKDEEALRELQQLNENVKELGRVSAAPAVMT
ncbi:MAG: hypothetical protein AAGI37_15445 [Planctomycetota bacterium]